MKQNYEIKNSIIETILATTSTLCNIIHKAYFAEIVAIEIDKKHYLSEYINFRVYVGGSIIWNIPFNLLYKLSNIKINGDSYYIALSNKIFMEHMIMPLPMYKLMCNQVHIELVTSIDTPISYKLHIRHINSEDYVLPLGSIIGGDTTSYTIREYRHKPLILINNTDVYNTRLIRPSGFFIETLPLKSLSINLGDGIHTKKYNSNALNLHIVHKDEWTQHKSEVFNIIMEKVLPYEMIHHIEEYICDTYMYYIPIDYEIYTRNLKYLEKIHDGVKINVGFDEHICGEIYYVYSNDFVTECDMGCKRFIYI